jgi:hypothetical protein
LSASEVTRQLPVYQNAIPDYFLLCDAAEEDEETEPIPDLPNKSRVM